MHCGVKFQPYFQEQSSILSQVYLRDIFCLSWRDLILWKARPQWCAANMVLWSHSWNREKIHFWTLSKMNVWKNTREVQNGCFKFHSIPVTWSYTLVALLDTSDIPQRLKAASPWVFFVRQHWQISVVKKGIVSAQAGWELFQAKVEAPNWITWNSQVYFCCKASLISDRYEEPPRSNTSRTGFPNFCVRSVRSGRPGELVTSRDRILLVRQGRDIFIFQSLDEPWNLFQIANFSLPRCLQTIDTKGERSKLETPKLLCCLP